MLLFCTKREQTWHLRTITVHVFEEAIIMHIPDHSELIKVRENFKLTKNKIKQILNLVLYQLSRIFFVKYNNMTIIFSVQQTKGISNFLLTRSVYTFPHEMQHDQDNFVVKHDKKKGNLCTFVCLWNVCQGELFWLVLIGCSWWTMEKHLIILVLKHILKQQRSYWNIINNCCVVKTVCTLLIKIWACGVVRIF